MNCGSLLSLRNTATYSSSTFISCFNCTDFCYNQANDVGLLLVNNIFTQQTHAAQNSHDFFFGGETFDSARPSFGRKTKLKKKVDTISATQLHIYQKKCTNDNQMLGETTSSKTWQRHVSAGQFLCAQHPRQSTNAMQL